jgi:predicted nucleotidyltransferase component of viral defense system
MNDLYKKQVALLIRIMPSVYKITDFAVHGGTAINLFHKDMPRYSVDIDITYIPIQGREESLKAINVHLLELKKMIEKTIPGIRVTHKPDVWKLQCVKDGATVKIEVNGTKRGLVGATEDKTLCAKAQTGFNMSCKARIVSFSQLYGGKISAALSRQHPRDLFDCKYMPLDSLADVKDGLIFCLLGSDKPILESLQPNSIDQQDALENQFKGMTDTPFTYEDYEATRKELIDKINAGFTDDDKAFLLSFEQGEPEWDKCSAGDLSSYPSVKWKLQNILKLKETNSEKFNAGVEKLRGFLFPVIPVSAP